MIFCSFRPLLIPGNGSPVFHSLQMLLSCAEIFLFSHGIRPIDGKNKNKRMNYLAHIALSGKNGKIQIGNFIGDAVKGRAYENYPPNIRRGILLHRAIDHYADHHPVFKEFAGLLKESFGRYAGVMADIFMDYLLASEFRRYTGKSLRGSSFRFYLHMIRNYRNLPSRIRRFMWHFIGTNRLMRYASPKGIRESLEIMAYYKKLPVPPEEAVHFLLSEEKTLRKLFDLFWPEMVAFSAGFAPPEK